MPGTRALFLLNPTARQPRDRAGEVVERLRALGLELAIVDAAGPAGLPALLRRRTAGVDRVPVAGGDGTLNAAAQGLGELGPCTPARFTVVPRALAVLCPPAAGDSP